MLAKNGTTLCHYSSLRKVIELKGRSLSRFHTNLHLRRTWAETPASAEEQEWRIQSTCSILRSLEPLNSES